MFLELSGEPIGSLNDSNSAGCYPDSKKGYLLEKSSSDARCHHPHVLANDEAHDPERSELQTRDNGVSQDEAFRMSPSLASPIRKKLSPNGVAILDHIHGRDESRKPRKAVRSGVLTGTDECLKPLLGSRFASDFTMPVSHQDIYSLVLTITITEAVAEISLTRLIISCRGDA